MATVDSTAPARAPKNRKGSAGTRRTTKSCPAEAIYRNFVEQPAQISKESLDAIEERFGCVADRVTRRLALHSLTRSGAELAEAAQDDEIAKGIAETAVCAEEYSKRLMGLADLMKTAAIRLELSMASRPDMMTLLEMAKSGAEVQS